MISEASDKTGVLERLLYWRVLGNRVCRLVSIASEWTKPGDEQIRRAGGAFTSAFDELTFVHKEVEFEVARSPWTGHSISPSTLD
jgi:hypothetical protein